VDEIKKGISEPGVVEEVCVPEFFPKRVMAVEVAEPRHVVIVRGGGEDGVAQQKGVDRSDGAVVGVIVVYIEKGNAAGGGAEVDGCDVARGDV
jgi:hypothetical protein